LAVYQHLQRLSPRYYARTRLGDIVARLNNDLGEIQRVAAETLLAWVGNVLFLIGTVAFMAWLDARLFAVSLLPLPLSIWFLSKYRARLSQAVGVLRQASADVGTFLIETLQGMKFVVASNAQAREVARFRERNQAFVRALMAMQRVSYLAGGLPGLILGGSTLLVFVYGGTRVIEGTLTLGTFVAFLAYQMRMLQPIQGLMGLYTNFATLRVSLDRVREILDVQPEVIEGERAVPLAEARGHLTFERVHFSFGRSTPALAGVSFEVRPGESVAIVGESGTGKSTIADLARRMLDPDGGIIRLDAQDLRSLRLEDVRRLVVMVDQEPLLFHASIRDNLRYLRPEASQGELEAAIAAAGLERFLSTLPDGYNTIVGERGVALSAGERQRLAIARALVARPAILILDEATAALDPINEQSVVEGYEKAMHGRTTILISHRLHLAQKADRVLVLKDAQIVEEGRPAVLLARGGAFAALFAAHASPVES
jgi:ATP-binding cassette, subfamily B, bacterial